MITVTNLSLNYSGTPLFSHVDLQFARGNCYGIIGEHPAQPAYVGAEAGPERL